MILNIKSLQILVEFANGNYEAKNLVTFFKQLKLKIKKLLGLLYSFR